MPASPTRPILLGTRNPAKQARLRWLLDGLGFTDLTPDDLPPAPEPEETGASFAANAALKARYWSRLAGGLAIASDGGVAVPALGERWQALRTRRASGAAPGDDLARIDHLLDLLRPFRGAERRVIWHEAVALADQGALLAVWEVDGQLGEIAESYDPARVNPGFWIESVWRYPELGKVHAELTPEELARVQTWWDRLRAQVRAAFGAPP